MRSFELNANSVEFISSIDLPSKRGWSYGLIFDEEDLHNVNFTCDVSLHEVYAKTPKDLAFKSFKMSARRASEHVSAAYKSRSFLKLQTFFLHWWLQL